MLHKALQYLQITRAVKWSLLTQAFRLLSGVVTTLLYIKYLDLRSLGYAYTFASVLGISIFLEMGFSQNIVQFVCHEFSKLRFTHNGSLDGDRDALSRVISIGRLSFKYYSIASGILLILLLTCGKFFLEGGEVVEQSVNWQGAWILASVVACASLVINPMWSMFEGCNRIGDTERLKFIASLIGLIATFVGLHYGLGLYAVCFNSLAVVFVSFVYFVLFNSAFIRIFLSKPQSATISWRNEIWPLQWRIAISWISGYFIFSSITPIVFRIAGPENAGRVGFSLQITRLIGSVSTAWSSTRIPEFGMCVAGRDWQKLDCLWKKSAKIGIAVVVVGNIFVVLFMHLASAFFYPIQERYIGFTPICFFALSAIVHIATNLFSYYLRAFKQEPYALLSFIGGIITTVSIYFATIQFNVLGTSLAYFACNFVLAYFAYRIFKIKKNQYICLAEKAN